MRKDQRRKPQTPAERQRFRRARLRDEAAVSSPALWFSACSRANYALALMLHVMRCHRIEVAALMALVEALKVIQADAHRGMRWRKRP
jgi:hypothetical protein